MISNPFVVPRISGSLERRSGGFPSGDQFGRHGEQHDQGKGCDVGVAVRQRLEQSASEIPGFEHCHLEAVKHIASPFGNTGAVAIALGRLFCAPPFPVVCLYRGKQDGPNLV